MWVLHYAHQAIPLINSIPERTPHPPGQLLVLTEAGVQTKPKGPTAGLSAASRAHFSLPSPKPRPRGGPLRAFEEHATHVAAHGTISYQGNQADPASTREECDLTPHYAGYNLFCFRRGHRHRLADRFQTPDRAPRTALLHSWVATAALVAPRPGMPRRFIGNALR